MFPPPEFKGIPTEVSEEFFRSAKQMDGKELGRKCEEEEKLQEMILTHGQYEIDKIDN